jgi:hypothetical protein
LSDEVIFIHQLFDTPEENKLPNYIYGCAGVFGENSNLGIEND